MTIPLAIHGTVARKAGTVLNITIGESEEAPVFVIADLFIHLSQKQVIKETSKEIEGEQLDVMIGRLRLLGAY